jgi:hypothetical protein
VEWVLSRAHDYYQCIVQAVSDASEGEIMMHALLLANAWQEWQNGVVAVLRADFRELLEDVQFDDVDWDAWRPLYDEGRSPRSAVDRALVRDL